MAEGREFDLEEKTLQAGDGAGQAETEEKELSIEESLAELEDLIEKMEDRGSTLEQTFAYYEKGMKLVKACTEKIGRVEKKIIKLAEEGQSNGV